MTKAPTKPYVVVMPRLGLSMTEGTIVEWSKKDGEWINKGEELFTFESDKSAIAIEAPASGPVHILVPVGATVVVQTPVAVIGEPVDLSPAPTDAQDFAERGHAGGAAVGRRRPGEAIAASPRARAQARDRGLDLDGISGSGIRGMVVVGDLDKARSETLVRATPVARRLAEKAGLDLASIAASGPNNRITRTDVENAMANPVPSGQGLTGLRAIIAERLSTGWRERPQVTLTTQADAVQLLAVRQATSSDSGFRISFDALFVRILARALTEFRYMNATLTPSGIREIPEINIGVATDTERGLLVPVLHGADQMTLEDISRALAELSERAQSGLSSPDDLTGGTFTITNLGMYGIDGFTPIINPPECGILGVGRIVRRPVEWQGGVGLREQVTLSLSFDHRLVDGAPAARFLARIRELIEQPSDALEQK